VSFTKYLSTFAMFAARSGNTTLLGVRALASHCDFGGAHWCVGLMIRDTMLILYPLFLQGTGFKLSDMALTSPRMNPPRKGLIHGEHGHRLGVGHSLSSTEAQAPNERE